MNVLRYAAAGIAAAVLFAVAPARAASSDPRVAELIASSGKAINVAALAQVSTIRFDESISAVGLSGTVVQYVNVRDGRFAETTTLAPLVSLDGYDGKIEWSGDRTHLVWNQGGDSDRSSELNQAYLESYALWAPNASGADVTSLGTKVDAGKSYDVLAITPAGSKSPFELWLDPATHLPGRAHFVSGFTTQTLTFSDYRAVNGLNVAHAIHIDSSDGNNSDIAVTNVAFDPPGAEAALARPATRPTDFSITGGKTSTTVPIELGENHVYLDVMLNGKGPYHFIFDTGGSNVVDPAVAKEIGALGTGSAQGSGVGSQTEGLSFANVSKLQVGDAVLNDQVFAVAPTRMGFGVSAGRPVDGLIGWEVLARFVTTFDYAGLKVTLAMPGSAAAAGGRPRGTVRVLRHAAADRVHDRRHSGGVHDRHRRARHDELHVAVRRGASRGRAGQDDGGRHQRLRLRRPGDGQARTRARGGHRRHHADQSRRGLLHADGGRVRGAVRRREHRRQPAAAVHRDVRLRQRHDDAGAERGVYGSRQLRALGVVPDQARGQRGGGRGAARHAGRNRGHREGRHDREHQRLARGHDAAAAGARAAGPTGRDGGDARARIERRDEAHGEAHAGGLRKTSAPCHPEHSAACHPERSAKGVPKGSSPASRRRPHETIRCFSLVHARVDGAGRGRAIRCRAKSRAAAAT